MRFQPSWVLEVLEPLRVDAIFLPLAPRPESLVWFKRQGIRIYANHPLESRAMLLRALLENQNETFTAANRAKLPAHPGAVIGKADHPFRRWEGQPFSRLEVDFLAVWREMAAKLEPKRQGELLAGAVRSYLHYRLALVATGAAPRQTPDELLKHCLDQQVETIVEGTEPVFALHLPFEELGDEVESTLYLVPLPIREKVAPAPNVEEYFHAWWMEHGDVEAARAEIRGALQGWTFSWDAPIDFKAIAAKAGKTTRVGITWTADELPPRIHEENLATPLRTAFNSRFPKGDLYMKCAERRREDYDFLLLMRP